MIQKPSFFILGAPKSGTTSLAHYLSEHPEIYVSDPKETNYFDTDLHPRRFCTDDEYLKAYFDVPRTYQAVGEGTAWNLYSRTAVSNILKLSPDARFIVLLRDPAAQFHSLYHHRRAGGREQCADITQAWSEQSLRAYDSVANARVTLCADLYKQGVQLERLITAVGRERVLVLFFDDFIADTQQAYRTTLAFLGVANDGRADFHVVNPNRASRNEFTRRAIIGYQRFKRKLQLPIHLGSTWFARTVVYGKKPPLPETLRETVRTWCYEDTKRIERLTNRSLTQWYPKQGDVQSDSTKA